MANFIEPIYQFIDETSNALNNNTMLSYIVSRFEFYGKYCLLFVVAMYFPSADAIRYINGDIDKCNQNALQTIFNRILLKSSIASAVIFVLEAVLKNATYWNVILSLTCLWLFFSFFVMPLLHYIGQIRQHTQLHNNQPSLFSTIEVSVVVLLFLCLIFLASTYVENNYICWLLGLCGIIGLLTLRFVTRALSKKIAGANRRGEMA